MNKLIGIGVIIALVVAGIGIYYFFGMEPTEEEEAEYWTWEIAEGWNDVTFTEEQIDDCISDGPEDVFDSISTNIDAVFEDGTWDNWRPNEGGNSLSTITPGNIYKIHALESCTLKIEKV